MKISRRVFVRNVAMLAGSTIPASWRSASRAAHSSRLLSFWAALPQAGLPGIPRPVVEDFSKPLDPAYLSNGLIGIRVGPNPLARAKTQVSGFVLAHVPYEVESLSPAPYPLETDIRVGSVGLLGSPDLVSVKRQTLDMSCGELITELTFTPQDGPGLVISILQFASRSVPALLCQEIRVVASRDSEITFVPAIDSEGTLARLYMNEPPARTSIDLAGGFESNLGAVAEGGKLGVAVYVTAPDGQIQRQEFLPTETRLTRDYVVRAKAGESFRFRTIAAMVSSLYHPEPPLEAIRLASWGTTVGFDELRDANRKAWEELWRSRVKISGDTAAQRAVDCAFFYLHSSVHHSVLTGMPPFGLSQSAYYYGHSFWDTESWSLLPITLANPAAARSLCGFRVRGLEAAKRQAALYGYSGAQFPWEAAQTEGFEVTPTFAGTGWEEQHCTPDIALGLWEYQLATNDEGFLREAVWPVLRAVAEWIESRGVWTARGFEIRHIMGPDEGVPNINNNSYMNLVCKMVLSAAVRCSQMAGASLPSSWEKMRDALVLPLDREKNIVLPYDNAPPAGSPKYSVAMLDFLTVHNPPVSADLLRNTFTAEQELSGPRPAGALMGTIPHPIGFAVAAMAATAAFLGEKQRAAQLFEASWKDAWLEPFGMMREVATENYGCFVTTFGSVLQTVMLGFTGLRVSEGDWAKFPASLPAGWTRIEIERLWMRGNPVRLVAEDGARARIH